VLRVRVWGKEIDVRARVGVGGAVFHAADALAQAIQQTPQWEEWENARAAFDRDDDVKRLRARLERVASRWRAAQAAGKGLIGQEARELAEAQEALQGHALFVRQQEAGRQLVVLFQQTNELISSMLGIDFAANALPRGGGCCG